MTGIYSITNKFNNKVYIGQSKDIIDRWSKHEKALLKNEHHSVSLQTDFNFYGGIEAFKFDVVELCEAASLREKENYYIERYDSIENGYNAPRKNKTSERSEIVLTNTSYKELQNRIGCSYITTYLYLRFNADDKNQIVLNQSQLADELGVNNLTISKHVRHLMDNSIIKYIGKSGQCNKYEILI